MLLKTICNLEHVFHPLWASIGFQVFNVCYDTGATYHVVNASWSEWVGTENIFYGR